MQFQWTDYTPAYSAIVDAIRYIGLDDGWESGYHDRPLCGLRKESPKP